MTISSVYSENKNSGKVSNLKHHKITLGAGLTKIVFLDWYATLSQVT